MKAGFVSLVGRPNAGKSSLLNRLVGTKLAIVSDKPQTTRNRILGVRTYEGGQVVFLDTPGIHKPLHRMNVRMLDVARDAMRDVDVIGLVVDAADRSGAGDAFTLELVQRARSTHGAGAEQGGPASPSRSSCPMIDEWSRRAAFADIVPVSALTGDNVDRLEQVLLSHLPEGEPLYPADYLTDQPERFFVAEMVREQVLRHTHAELPYSTAVVVDQFEEPDDRGTDAAVLHDPRGAGFAEADRDRTPRRDDQTNRHAARAKSSSGSSMPASSWTSV